MTSPRKRRFGALLLAAFLAASSGAAAREPACSIVADAATGAVLERIGRECDVPTSPNSTFKVALALIGFESSLLVGAHEPAWMPRPGDDTTRPSWQGPVDPTAWLRESVVWYSQDLTRRLGMPRLQAAIDRIDYGNRDLSGDPGKGNGLTRAWLSGSLKITATEQVAFLRRLLADPSDAAAKTRAALPAFEAPPGWTIRGKTGTGFVRRPDDTLDRARQIGWFVGYAEMGDRRLVFARLIKDGERMEDYAGPRARDEMLTHLSSVLRRP